MRSSVIIFPGSNCDRDMDVALKKFGFKAPIAYGMLAGSLLSNIIGNKIPGAGALWTDCNIAFSKPVFKNDMILNKDVF